MNPFLAVRGAATVVALFALAACAPLTVRSYVDNGVDLSRYRTYDWQAESTWTGDPRLDANPFFHDYLRTAIESELLAHRIERTTYGMADLLVHYHASTTQQFYTRGEEGNSPCTDCRLEVYDAGTILIDFIDARTEKLVWRGWAEGGIDGVIDNQTWLERRIDEAVSRIFERLPAGLARATPVF
jgi:hypothetical protein